MRRLCLHEAVNIIFCYTWSLSSIKGLGSVGLIMIHDFQEHTRMAPYDLRLSICTYPILSIIDQLTTSLFILKEIWSSPHSNFFDLNFDIFGSQTKDVNDGWSFFFWPLMLGAIGINATYRDVFSYIFTFQKTAPSLDSFVHVFMAMCPIGRCNKYFDKLTSWEGLI